MPSLHHIHTHRGYHTVMNVTQKVIVPAIEKVLTRVLQRPMVTRVLLAGRMEKMDVTNKSK